MTLVRVEYNEVILGDSSKTDVLPNGTASYNFTTSFECSPDEPDSLDNIVQKPVLCKYLMPKLPPRGDHADLLCPLQESLDKNSASAAALGGSQHCCGPCCQLGESSFRWPVLLRSAGFVSHGR